MNDLDPTLSSYDLLDNPTRFQRVHPYLWIFTITTSNGPRLCHSKGPSICKTVNFIYFCPYVQTIGLSNILLRDRIIYLFTLSLDGNLIGLHGLLVTYLFSLSVSMIIQVGLLLEVKKILIIQEDGFAPLSTT